MRTDFQNPFTGRLTGKFAIKSSGVTIGRARRAVHAGPALWGPKICPTLFFLKLCWGKRGPFWNTCTRAHCYLVTPLIKSLLNMPPYVNRVVTLPCEISVFKNCHAQWLRAANCGYCCCQEFFRSFTMFLSLMKKSISTLFIFGSSCGITRLCKI